MGLRRRSRRLEVRMPVLYVIGGVVAIGLLIYLVMALLKPEVFS